MIKLNFEQRQELSRILDLAPDEDALAEVISRIIEQRDEWGDKLYARIEAERRSPDEGKMPTGDDVVIAVRHVLVPRDMKCHKCGAPDPWKDERRGPSL